MVSQHMFMDCVTTSIIEDCFQKKVPLDLTLIIVVPIYMAVNSPLHFEKTTSPLAPEMSQEMTRTNDISIDRLIILLP